jgi:hypothetical protein
MILPTPRAIGWMATHLIFIPDSKVHHQKTFAIFQSQTAAPAVALGFCDPAGGLPPPACRIARDLNVWF